VRPSSLGGLVLALSSWISVACSCAPPSDPELELGTGSWRFEPVEDGREVPLVRGAQGGWHVWISVRAEHLDASTGSLEITMQPADESRPPQRASVGVRFDPPDAQGRRAYLGWPAILEDPSCAVGELYRFEAVLTDPAGRQLRAERELLIAGGENPPPPCDTAGL
jgi:hypothetical protein